MEKAKENPKAVWLDRALYEPQGSMILWRYPNYRLKNTWRLSLAYLAKSGDYIDCGGSAGGFIPDMTHFMEIPE